MTTPIARETPAALDTFLRDYRAVLARVGRLGTRAGLTAAAAVRALAGAPFTLPDALRQAGPDGPSVGGALEALAARRATLGAAPWEVERAVIEALAAEFASASAVPPAAPLAELSAAQPGVRSDELFEPPHPPPPAIRRQTRSVEPPPRPLSDGLAGAAADGGAWMDVFDSFGAGDELAAEPVPARGPGLLGDDAAPPAPVPPPPPAAVPGAAPAPSVAADAPSRWFNAEFEDQPADAPFRVGTSYALAFGVGTARTTALGGSAPVVEAVLFPDGVDELELTVELASDDFRIPQPTRPLRLPRAGASRGKARFDVEPLHDGPCALVATVHNHGNFVQRIELTVTAVGAAAVAPAAPLAPAAAVTVAAVGRAAGSSAALRPRNVSLTLTPTADGYDCIVVGAVSARARLRVTPVLLAAAVEAARQAMTRVVMLRDDAGRNVFQDGIDIPVAQSEVADRILARAGARLFQQLFEGPGAGPDSLGVADYLRRQTRDPAVRLTLQVVAEGAPVPWAMLYVGDAPDEAAGALPAPDRTCFLGLRHVIEQIPLQNTLAVADASIASDRPGLAVSVNVNSGIDAQFGVSVVADQQRFWSTTAAACAQLRLTSRSTRDQLMRALANAGTDDQILYFYGHAQSTGVGAAGGPDASALVLSDARVTLGDLYLDAPTRVPLAGSPLVFLNACESAELSPTFYDGFVPYFMAKGARGVIGTECRTPALFAAEWARRFFERFLAGESVGDAVLALRQEFRERHGNPLGLLYAVHCDSDTQVAPALPVPAPPGAA